MNRKLLTLLIAAMLPLPAAAGGPSTAEIREAIDRAEYTGAVKMASQALRQLGAAGKRTERYELLMLRGEALAAGGSPSSAVYAFEGAMRAADGSDQLAAARAESLLARQAMRAPEPPRARAALPAAAAAKAKPGTPPSPLLVPEAHKRTMRELYQSLREPLEPKVREAATANTLPPMYDLLPAVLDLAALEATADGSLEGTMPLLHQLGERARELIGEELRRIDSDVDRIELGAGEVEGVMGGGYFGRRGLHTADRKALEEMRPYLGRILAATRDGRAIAELVRNPQAVQWWKDLGVQASDTAARVESVLSRRY